jgi:hypothetical protein
MRMLKASLEGNKKRASQIFSQVSISQVPNPIEKIGLSS